jgi:hypothetical protein
MKSTLLTLLIYLSSILSSPAQLNPVTRIDSLLTEMTKKDEFSGAVLIAGPSKVFTGTAVTYLAQQGKIKFTDTIGKYIKGLPGENILLPTKLPQLY